MIVFDKIKVTFTSVTGSVVETIGIKGDRCTEIQNEVQVGLGASVVSEKKTSDYFSKDSDKAFVTATRN